jgi:hypothetical protein
MMCLKLLSKTTENTRIVTVTAEIQTVTSGIHTTSDTVSETSSVMWFYKNDSEDHTGHS